MTLYTGKEFNEKFPTDIFVKLTAMNENHNGYQFVDGLNIDSVPFSYDKMCSRGGIYFCKLDNISRWYTYGRNTMYYMRRVTILDDSKVFDEGLKYKADKIFLGERQIIYENEEYCKGLTQYDWKRILGINNQAEKLCINAIKANGLALEWILNKTKEMCELAISLNYKALIYLPDEHKTEDIYLYAFKFNLNALEFIPDKYKTKEMCLRATKFNMMNVLFVPDKFKTEDMMKYHTFYSLTPYANSPDVEIIYARHATLRPRKSIVDYKPFF